MEPTFITWWDSTIIHPLGPFHYLQNKECSELCIGKLKVTSSGVYCYSKGVLFLLCSGQLWNSATICWTLPLRTRNKFCVDGYIAYIGIINEKLIWLQNFIQGQLTFLKWWSPAPFHKCPNQSVWRDESISIRLQLILDEKCNCSCSSCTCSSCARTRTYNQARHNIYEGTQQNNFFALFIIFFLFQGKKETNILWKVVLRELPFIDPIW